MAKAEQCKEMLSNEMAKLCTETFGNEKAKQYKPMRRHGEDSLGHGMAIHGWAEAQRRSE